MRAIMRRLEEGERSWPAEVALRAFGIALLGLCASAAWWVYRAVNQPPAHEISWQECLAAALAVLCWALGWAFLVEGPGLFRLIWVPTRHWTI